MTCINCNRSIAKLAQSLQENSLLFASLASETFRALANTSLRVAVTTATALVCLGGSSQGDADGGGGGGGGEASNAWLATIYISPTSVDSQQVLGARVGLEGYFVFEISSTGGVILNSHILDNLVGEGFQGSFNGACKSGPRGGDSVDGAGGPRGSVQVLEGEAKTVGSGWGGRRERNFLHVVPLGSSLGEHSGQRIVALQAHTTRAVRSVVAGVATATLDLVSIPFIATRQFREVFA